MNLFLSLWLACGLLSFLWALRRPRKACSLVFTLSVCVLLGPLIVAGLVTDIFWKT